jgi:nucleoside-diphosphate-sugar epimerase
MLATIVGGKGFIGSHLFDYLLNQGWQCWIPSRDDERLFESNLGHVFYCAGITADFRSRPFDTVDAHVCVIKKLLDKGRFDSLTYLSSTRLYENSCNTHETSVLKGVPVNPDHLYNFSKLMGESLCLSTSNKTKIVRLSNVYGNQTDSENFLSSVLKESAINNSVHFLTTPDSSKDYISIDQVVRMLPKIAVEGVYPIYNLASGQNTTNASIAHSLEVKGVKTSFDKDAMCRIFPTIDISRLVSEFGSVSNTLQRDLPKLLNYYRLKV